MVTPSSCIAKLQRIEEMGAARADGLAVDDEESLWAARITEEGTAELRRDLDDEIWL